MALKFCSLSSGSSGNCYLVKTDNTAILVDAGISGRRILQGLDDTGTQAEQVKALLITHEHIDHVRSVRTLTKKLAGLKVFSNEATWRQIGEGLADQAHVSFVTGEDFEIGDIQVTSFHISHDAAEPVGFCFSAEGKRIGLVTDTGVVTEEIYSRINDADLLVIEANHDVNTLQFCRYPYSVKRRILGDKGHLSNDAAGETVCRILAGMAESAERAEAERAEAGQSAEDMRRPLVLLAHLSRENNFPEMAKATLQNRLEEEDFYIGRHLDVDIILRDAVSKIYTL